MKKFLTLFVLIFIFGINCVYAAKVANAIGVKTIALTGAKESKLKELSLITIQAPSIETFKIQEYTV